MPIISVRDNEIKKLKRNTHTQKKTTTATTKTSKDRKEQRRTEAIIKKWELNDFAVHLS